jgi:hypothetical protein
MSGEGAHAEASKKKHKKKHKKNKNKSMVQTNSTSNSTAPIIEALSTPTPAIAKNATRKVDPAKDESSYAEQHSDVATIHLKTDAQDNEQER